MGDKWTLLIIRDLVSGPRRFVELQRVLPGISTEQLRSRLNRMVADGLLTRKRYREVPPRVDYELTERAMELAPVLGELARWGYEWTWSPPRASESVDIGAIFRLIPGLVRDDSMSEGTVEMIVTDGDGDQPSSYMIMLAPGRGSITERHDGHADATIRGSQTAWIRALAPNGDRAELQTSGQHGLAELVLDIVALGHDRGIESAGAESAAI
ncbi:MAG: helix-turn-helix domain-containing protein [Solirubrobacteraceae bacterium]